MSVGAVGPLWFYKIGYIFLKNRKSNKWKNKLCSAPTQAEWNDYIISKKPNVKLSWSPNGLNSSVSGLYLLNPNSASISPISLRAANKTSPRVELQWCLKSQNLSPRVELTTMMHRTSDHVLSKLTYYKYNKYNLLRLIHEVKLLGHLSRSERRQF
jgi:hypothetical protein